LNFSHVKFFISRFFATAIIGINALRAKKGGEKNGSIFLSCDRQAALAELFEASKLAPEFIEGGP
jgi:hypothetical protein